jgi:hypothetical protein
MGLGCQGFLVGRRGLRAGRMAFARNLAGSAGASVGFCGWTFCTKWNVFGCAGPVLQGLRVGFVGASVGFCGCDGRGLQDWWVDFAGTGVGDCGGAGQGLLDCDCWAERRRSRWGAPWRVVVGTLCGLCNHLLKCQFSSGPVRAATPVSPVRTRTTSSTS